MKIYVFPGVLLLGKIIPYIGDYFSKLHEDEEGHVYCTALTQLHLFILLGYS
jgi:hypothetical protein